MRHDLQKKPPRQEDGRTRHWRRGAVPRLAPAALPTSADSTASDPLSEVRAASACHTGAQQNDVRLTHTRFVSCACAVCMSHPQCCQWNNSNEFAPAAVNSARSQHHGCVITRHDQLCFHCRQWIFGCRQCSCSSVPPPHAPTRSASLSS